MLIARNDEEKRTRIWSRGMIISSVIIIFVAGYLFIKMFNENPVAGEWMDDDGNYAVNILNNGTLYVTDFSEGDKAEEMELLYKLDKEARMIAISSDEKVLEDVMEVSDSEHAEEALETEFNDQTVIFNYSVDNDQLILTEREYGEQMILIKE